MPKNIAIKVARAEKDMTQKVLAEAVGVSRQTINAIEKGEYNPTIKLCRKICRVLDLSIDCLRNGIWDRKLKPNLKTNIIVSSIAAVLAGIICFSVSYRNYHKLIGSIATGVIMFVQVEILCLIVLMISSKIYKRRVQKLEEDENPSN